MTTRLIDTTHFRPAGPLAQKRWPGRRFGRWTVLRCAGYAPYGGLHVVCRCECGAQAIVSCINLTSRASTQCVACMRQAAQVRGAAQRSLRQKQSQSTNRPIVGWRKYNFGPLPLYACSDCGAQATGARCRSCAVRARWGRPLKYPISIGELAQRHGLSRQRIHQLIVKLGWDGMMQRMQERTT